ncbi:MAG: squalene synthase HpnC [Pseudomonadota bacterium]
MTNNDTALTGPAIGSVLGAQTKGAADENFPVGSFLIAKNLRPHVMRYYAFARATDDIADHPSLQAHEKLRRLDNFEAGLDAGALAPEIATRLRESLAATGVPDTVARDLLVAFRRDALNERYADWQALLGYCRYSAHPVGRYLLHLHGEAEETGPVGDALCAALQVLNHLQDIGDDYRHLSRVYLPTEWLEAEGVTDADLLRDAATTGLRRIIDRCLDQTEALLDRSEPLARQVRSRRLAAEIAVIQRLARRLAARLRREDPLAGRVKHSRLDLLSGLSAGLGRLVRP